MAQFGGLYRAQVINGIDPAARGRLEVLIPDVTPIPVWAEACSAVAPWRAESAPPFPPPGTQVWVMFERGDVDFPVVLGRVHGPPAGDGPTPGTLSGVRFPGGEVTLNARDAREPAVSLRLDTGASVTLSGAGLILDNGKGARIELAGPAVTVNNGALEVV